MVDTSKVVAATITANAAFAVAFNAGIAKTAADLANPPYHSGSTGAPSSSTTSGETIPAGPTKPLE